MEPTATPQARRVKHHAALAAATLAASAGVAFAQNNRDNNGDDARPLDAVMMRFPDISKDHIVFSYANDLWIVRKNGGTATPLASPPGPESFPRFSPDGQEIAFLGNYEGNRDLYTIGVPGNPNAGTANRVTYHPFTERLSDWTQNPDGSTSLIFSSAERTGITRAPDMFRVSPEGGRPDMLPIPYGTNGDISPDGRWLAYTPSDRDFRTWKRYRGGLASDIWLFNLETMESRRVTTWEGTDTQPMWVPGGDGSTLYYVSDRGPNHRLNIWAYNIEEDEHRQLTTFEDFDVKFPGIGPGHQRNRVNRGEMVFQVGPDLYTFDLLTESLNTVQVTVPGDRESIRRQTIDYAEFVSAGSPSPKGDFAVIEARGDIWVVPADKGGPKRNLTRTDGVAERDPLWSPSGRWIAYVSDETGEYEVYITQADGRGETRQLTDDSDQWRFIEAWAPDSKSLVFSDKSGDFYLLDIDSGEYNRIFTDPWNARAMQFPGAPGASISFSHDSKWIATSLQGENGQYAVHLYDVENGALHKVTSDFFNATSPAFDRKGEFLYYASTMSFQPTYSAVDTTFIYDDAHRLLAVPLNNDVENPMLPEIDQISWEEEENDEDEDIEDTTDDDGDAEADDADEQPEEDVHPLQGVWSVNFEGLQSVGMPGIPDTQSSTWYVHVNDEGEILGYTESQGEQQALADILNFDEDTGELTIERTIEFPGGVGSITSTSNVTVDDGSFEGTWNATGNVMGNPLNGNGTVIGERSDTELTDEQRETINDVNGSAEETDEPLRIDLEGFEQRAMMLPVDNGSYGLLTVNDKNQLLFADTSEGPAAVKLFNINSPDDGARSVIGPVLLYQISGDGKKLLATRSPSQHAMVSAAPGQSFADTVDLSDMTRKIQPRDEWAQILRDAWRVQRDFLYVDNMHGVDWNAIYERYAAILPAITTREDLSMLISEMISEINVGHAYYFGGDTEDQPSRDVGLLGADYELHTMTDDDGNDHSAYRITHIYHGAPWDADARGPLSQPGVHVEVGDYILEVNGTPIDTRDDIHAAFIGTAGDMTEITVSDTPWHIHDEEESNGENGNNNGDDNNGKEDDKHSTRFITVEPLGSEVPLRYRAWIEANRQHVAEASNGQIGYLHVPNTGVQGQNELFRQYYGQRDKAALIIDERWNGGGQIPTRFIELMNRPFVAAWARRDGRDWPWPPDAHFGPKAMLINGAAGSGGDMFPWLFMKMDIGETIGTRTWGGLVGISGNPALIDGGYTSAPTFGIYEADGTWAVEGHGVDPDIQVIDDPARMITDEPMAVADPQLDRAIEHLTEELQSGERFRMPQRPAPPDRSGMGIEPEDK